MSVEHRVKCRTCDRTSDPIASREEAYALRAEHNRLLHGGSLEGIVWTYILDDPVIPDVTP